MANRHSKTAQNIPCFDNPKIVKRLLKVLYGVCMGLFLLDFVIHRHIYHDWELIKGFYPIFGFSACIGLVLVAKWMRKYIARPENYYDTVKGCFEYRSTVSKKPDSKGRDE